MNGFYVLAKPCINRSTSSPFFYPDESVKIGDAPTCPKCGNSLGMCKSVGEYIVEIEFPKDSAEDVCFGPDDEVLFSERLKTSFESSQLKGADFQPVKVAKVCTHKRKSLSIPEYYRTSISRSRALVDVKASGFEVEGKIKCKECYLSKGGIIRYRRIVFVPDTWSGEDIFYARGLPGTIITSQRLYDMFSSIGLPADLLIPAEKYSIDHFPGVRVSRWRWPF
jgi:hypothetical protein